MKAVITYLGGDREYTEISGYTPEDLKREFNLSDETTFDYDDEGGSVLIVDKANNFDFQLTLV